MLTRKFMALFAGLDRAYGVYEVTSSREDGKLTGKAATKIAPVTEELWNGHLNGTASLGIVPINDDSMCRFGAIDIDVYPLDHKSICEKIKKAKLPLIVCRSKSGGCHLWLFTKEFIPAAIFQKKLQELASGLGYGSCEIFPKQTEILAERGDVGQWINMPYFKAKETTRYAFNSDGKELNAEEFLLLAKRYQVSPNDFDSLSVHIDNVLEDGPPCLQHLITQGFPDGTRNNGLYNLGVYLKRSQPENWENEIEEYNRKYMYPPLDSTNVQGVCKSLHKKDYFYKCKDQPLCDHCNISTCRMRKFGIGQGGSTLPVMHSLTKYNSEPPIWFIDIEDGGRIELTTDDLQNQVRFQRRCMEALNIMPMPMNKVAWTQTINQLLENVQIIDTPEDASPIGMLTEYVEKFLTGRVQAHNRDELILGKPWFNEEDRRHYFKIHDLMSYLERHHFKDFKVNRITSILKSRGAEHHFFNIKGKGGNYWSLPEINKFDSELDTPESLNKENIL